MRKFFLPSRSIIAVALAATFMVFSCKSELDEPVSPIQSQSGARIAGDKDGDEGKEYVTDEVLVKFSEEATSEKKSKAYEKVEGKEDEDIYTESMKKAGKKEGIKVVKIKKDVRKAIEELESMPGVEFAEPNYVYQHAAVATDPYFTNGSLWGMYGAGTSPANPYGSNAAAAWAAGTTGSAAVYVGVIDEGIQFAHPDLNGQVWTNPFDPADGRDNDQNGYKDDIHGWDFDGRDNSIYDGGNRGGQDDHGTHVSGTIGGKANNGVGVVGVNWNVTLISTKFLGRNGGTTANAIKAIDYLTNLKISKGLNIVASNNSWGGGGYSQALYDAISRANNAGIMFIAAAGNSGTDNDATPSYPANYDLPNVITVAAISNTGGLASFSQYGATTVDIGAPGVGVWSTTASNTYESYNGTSMATPHVTGAVALYASTHPGASVAQIRNAILSSAVSTASLAGKTVTGGRLDVNAALSR